MRARRLVLGAIAAFGVGAPWLGACAASFDVPSRIEGLRVLAVTLDEPYAAEGDTVHFHMTWEGGGSFAGTTPQILWLAGCFDPPEDSLRQGSELVLQQHAQVRTPGSHRPALFAALLPAGESFLFPGLLTHRCVPGLPCQLLRPSDPQ